MPGFLLAFIILISPPGVPGIPDRVGKAPSVQAGQADTKIYKK